MGSHEMRIPSLLLLAASFSVVTAAGCGEGETICMEEGRWVGTFVQVTDNPSSCVDLPAEEAQITDFEHGVRYLLCGRECDCGTLLQDGSCDVRFETFCLDGDGDMLCYFSFAGKQGDGHCTVVEQGVNCEYDVTFAWSAQE